MDCAQLNLRKSEDSVQNMITAPPGLYEKLAQELNFPQRAAAARLATKFLVQFHPQPPWQAEADATPQPSEELLYELQKAIDREESIDVLFRGSEKRHWNIAIFRR
jgi:hypothetical protein